MKFKEEVFPYLNGKKFHNGLRVDFISHNDVFIDRIAFIENLCSNLKIIHFGCADHLPLIAEKIANNRWLHKVITDVADHCIGFDIDKEAIQFIREHLGYNNVYCCNILSEDIPDVMRKEQYDYIIFGEIIEHLDDPVFFLKKIRKKLNGRVRKIVITCPNAMFYKNFFDFFKHRECINTDHRFWFTPYTLAKIIHQSGAEVERFHFISPKSSKINFILNLFYKYFPTYQETIIMIASL